MTQNNILTKNNSVNLSRKNDNIHFSILSVIIVALVNKKPLIIHSIIYSQKSILGLMWPSFSRTSICHYADKIIFSFSFFHTKEGSL